jgi:hypothetical protein
MDAITFINQKIIAIELANALASFNIAKVADLLKEDGEYSILDEKNETVFTDKLNFIEWPSNRLDEFKNVNKGIVELGYEKKSEFIRSRSRSHSFLVAPPGIEPESKV